MTKEPKWTKGQEVYEVRHSGQIVKEKISKIYKNGNFILTRHKSQYRHNMTALEHLSKPLAEQYRTQGEFLRKFNKPLGAKYMGLHDDLIPVSYTHLTLPTKA